MFRRRAATLLAAAALALTLLPAAAATAAPQAPVDDARAAAGAPGLAAKPSNLLYLTAADRVKVLGKMANAGVKWVRIDLAWKDVQNERDEWHWDSYDQLVDAIIDAEMTPLAVIGKTPHWAAVGDCAGASSPDVCTPNTADFARFAGVAADHYSRSNDRRVRHWEIWNEPNNVDAWLHPDPGYYANLLVAASRAIRTAEPDAFVLTGGLAPVGTDPDGDGNIDEVEFLRAVYQAGAQAAFDAVAAHPYAHPRSPCERASDSGWWQMAAPRKSLRAVMENKGDGAKKIWMTEYGAPTAGRNAVSEAQQARFIRQAFGLARGYPWAGPLFVYTWRDGTDDDAEDAFGLRRADNTPKPAFETYGQSQRC